MYIYDIYTLSYRLSPVKSFKEVFLFRKASSAKAYMSGCRYIRFRSEGVPCQGLRVRFQTYPVSLGRRPAKARMSVADCSESSVLGTRTLSPYVPLRRTPSESVSATGHTGLWPGTHPPWLQPDTLGSGAGTPPRVCNRAHWALAQGRTPSRVCNRTCRALAQGCTPVSATGHTGLWRRDAPPVSATGHAGLWRRDAPLPCLQPDM